MNPDDFECPSGQQVAMDGNGNLYCEFRKSNGEWSKSAEQPTKKKSSSAVVTDADPDSSAVTTNRLPDSSSAPSNRDVIERRNDGPDGETTTTVTTNSEGTGTQTVTKPYDRVLKRDDRMPGSPMVTADRMERPSVTESRFETEQYQNDLLVDGGLNSFDKGLEGFFGQTFSAYSTRNTAWNDLIDIAKRQGVSPYDLLESGRRAYRPSAGSGGGGGGGTTRSFSEANEDDVRLLANNLSEEMIGRRIDDKEFARLLSRVRKEEQANPTVTTRSGDTSRTSGGVTTEARNEAMREVLVENPEFKDFQMGEGALRYTQRYIEEQSRKASL